MLRLYCQSLWPLYSAPRRDGNQPSFCSKGGGRLLPGGVSGGGGAGRRPRPRAPQTLRWFVVPAFLSTAWQPEGRLLLHLLRSLETHACFFFFFLVAWGWFSPPRRPQRWVPLMSPPYSPRRDLCPLGKGFSGWGPTVDGRKSPAPKRRGSIQGMRSPAAPLHVISYRAHVAARAVHAPPSPDPAMPMPPAVFSPGGARPAARRASHTSPVPRKRDSVEESAWRGWPAALPCDARGVGVHRDGKARLHRAPRKLLSPRPLSGGLARPRRGLDEGHLPVDP